MSLLSVGILIQNDSLWNDVTAALRRFPCRTVSDLREVQSSAVALNRISRCKPDIVFIELRDDPDGAELVMHGLKELGSPPVIVAVHHSPTVEAVVSALRAGANEFIHEPVQENLDAFMNRLQNRQVRGEGKVVGFMSAKGGSGSTTLACHAAVEVAKRVAAQDKRALLMDLDLNAGLAGFILKAEGDYSILDAMASLHKLDIDYWSRLVQSPYTGLDVLGAPLRPHATETVNLDHVQSIAAFARRHYAWTMLDLGKGFGRLANAALPEVDQVVVVTTGEIGSLHGTRKAFQFLEDSHYPRERTRLVLNRVQGRAKAAISEVETAIGLPVFAAVSDDYDELAECYTSGRLLPKRNQLGQELSALSARIIDEAPPVKRRTPIVAALSACTSWVARSRAVDGHQRRLDRSQFQRSTSTLEGFAMAPPR